MLVSCCVRVGPQCVHLHVKLGTWRVWGEEILTKSREWRCVEVDGKGTYGTYCE